MLVHQNENRLESRNPYFQASPSQNGKSFSVLLQDQEWANGSSWTTIKKQRKASNMKKHKVTLCIYDLMTVFKCCVCWQRSKWQYMQFSWFNLHVKCGRRFTQYVTLKHVKPFTSHFPVSEDRQQSPTQQQCSAFRRVQVSVPALTQSSSAALCLRIH